MKSFTAKQQYDSMSFFYSVLYAGYDPIFFENEFIDEHKNILDGLPYNARILDSSCGNGLQASALKRRGFDVTASDVSEEMVRLTKEYAESNELTFPIECIAWSELPNQYHEEFDLVFCYGNSISHSMGEDEMIQNLSSLYNIIKKGGRLVIDTRNWDKLIKHHQRFQTQGIKEYKGKKYIPIYIWNLKGFDQGSYVEIVFIEILNNQETASIPFRLDFTPFSHSSFLTRLKRCGYKIAFDTYRDEKDTYCIIAEK